jgi:hypothetical protein
VADRALLATPLSSGARDDSNSPRPLGRPVPRRGVLYSPARGVYSPRSPPQIAPPGGPSPGHPARVTPTQIFSAATKSNGMCASVGFNISFETSARSSTMQVLLCSTGAPSPGESWNVCRPTSVASPPRVPHRSSDSERDSTITALTNNGYNATMSTQQAGKAPERPLWLQLMSEHRVCSIVPAA